MSDISRIENKPVSQDSISAASAALRQPAKAVAAATGAGPQNAGATNSSSVVAIGQPPSTLGLYASNGTTAGQKSGAGAGNSDGSYTAGKDDVTVTIEKSDSGYDNKIYYSTDNFATRHFVGVDNQTGQATITGVKEGTKIDFGIDNGHGDFFRTGGAQVNADRVNHAVASKTSDGAHQVGFEDLRGGGDRDYNDAIISVRSTPVAAAPVVAAPAKAPAASTPAAAPAKPAAPAPVTAKAPQFPSTAPVASQTGKSESEKSDDAKKLSVTPQSAPKALEAEMPKKPAPAGTTQDVKASQPADKAASATPVVPSKAPAPPIAVAKTPAPAPTPVAVKPPVVATPALAEKDNRSGLGDGSNPGQGAGRANSPNTGTQNPSASKVQTLVAPTPVAVKPVATPVAATGAAKPGPAIAPTPIKAPEVTVAGKENRSGLGDGTNPGQGAGRANSPNTGTLNPSVSGSVTSTGKKTDDVAEAKVTGATIDKKAETAIKAYQIPQTEKFTTSVRV